jgi:ketosteroid isomerase-like protein
MQRVAKAFEQGDLDPLFSAIDENIVWKSAATRGGPFNFGGIYYKTDGVVELMSELTTEYFFHKFRPREILSSTERVWGLFDVEGEYLPLGARFGRPFEYECTIHWRMKGKKIIEHQTFFDTNALLRQQSVGLPSRRSKSQRVGAVMSDCDDDERGLRTVAQEFIDRLGCRAIDELNDLAEIAAGIGDDEMEKTWRDIARAVERLFN